MGEADYVTHDSCDLKNQFIEKKFDEFEHVTEKRLDAHHEDIAELKKIQIQNTMILERLVSQQEKMDKRLSEIEKGPADKWNTIIKTIITSLSSALAGGIVASIINSLAK